MVKRVACILEGASGSFPPPSKSTFIYRIDPGTIINFQIEAGSIINTSRTTLHIDKNKGISAEIIILSGEFSPLGHWIADYTFTIPGNYSIWVEYEDVLGNLKLKGSVNSLLVDPDIRVGGKSIPLNGICLQTVLTRPLGPINRWVDVLKEQKSLGYNLFHLTPIQELGFSRSLYSINDPNKLNSELFIGLDTEEAKLNALENVLAELELEGIGCIEDVVLNHSAAGCQFVEDYPSSTYNLENCPYLHVSNVLDKALINFSNSLARKGVKNYPNRNRIENERDLSNIMKIMRLELLPSLKLHEYFSINTESAFKDFMASETNEKLDQHLLEHLNSKGSEYFIRKFALQGEGEGRFSTKINGNLV